MATPSMPAAPAEDNPESTPDWVDANGFVIWDKWAELIAARAEAKKAQRQAAAPTPDWSWWASHIAKVAEERLATAETEAEVRDAFYWEFKAQELAERAEAAIFESTGGRR